jgi:hypothetical protein
MSTLGEGNPFLHELEIDVRTELVIAETNQPEEEADGVLDAELLLDPDVQRYEVALRSLLGAVEAMEDAAPQRPDARQSGPDREARELGTVFSAPDPSPGGQGGRSLPGYLDSRLAIGATGARRNHDEPHLPGDRHRWHLTRGNRDRDPQCPAAGWRDPKAP